MIVCMVMDMTMGVAMRMGHGARSVERFREGLTGPTTKMLYYNIAQIASAARTPEAYGLPIIIAIAAARKGNGIETAARNHTKRAGMKGISHKIRR